MARAYNQAQKFGVDMAIPDEVQGLQARHDRADGRFVLSLTSKEQVRTRAVVIATGAQYRRLAVDNLAGFEGSSVHYWASPLEGRLCAGQEVGLVGAGNSAGQAAVYLASQVASVSLIVRGSGLETSMARYLVDRIAATPNIEVLTQTEITALEGRNGVLETIHCRSHRSGDELKRAIRHLFLFIGAEPHTAWLCGSGVTLDGRGFVRTGDNINRPLETCLPGVFAIGDVRAGSVKRVAAAVGEGAQVVAALHAYFAETGSKPLLSITTGSR
ncbi:MAG TPA: NAD(P)/FAD-dependent oxidoreductase [Stellaceae bacterium]|nr:NAD(P)/FAD-dependent oxidoreductase [Stellaceae bacterium]